MPTRNELKKLAKTRLKEAKALFNNGLYDGACYLSGYVLEMSLKARICKLLDMDSYPERGEFAKAFKTHKLDDLIKLAGLDKKFQKELKANDAFYTNWSILTGWSESFRYNPVGTNARQNTKDIIDALEDPKDGVFTWIMKRW